MLYMRQGDLNNAIDMFKKTLAINANLPGSLTGIARAYLDTGSTELAAKYVERAAHLQPDSVQAHYLLSRVLVKEGKREEAQRESAKAEALRRSRAKEQDTEATSALPIWIAPNAELQGGQR